MLSASPWPLGTSAAVLSEKATAIHVFCAQGVFRGGDRFARHWHDVTRLDTAGFVDAAIADKARARGRRSQECFFAEKNTHGDVIDYHAAVNGGLQLIPGEDRALARLAGDDQHMIDDGLFLNDAEPFDTLLECCRVIEQKANAK